MCWFAFRRSKGLWSDRSCFLCGASLKDRGGILQEKKNHTPLKRFHHHVVRELMLYVFARVSNILHNWILCEWLMIVEHFVHFVFLTISESLFLVWIEEAAFPWSSIFNSSCLTPVATEVICLEILLSLFEKKWISCYACHQIHGNKETNEGLNGFKIYST